MKHSTFHRRSTALETSEQNVIQRISLCKVADLGFWGPSTTQEQRGFSRTLRVGIGGSTDLWDRDHCGFTPHTESHEFVSPFFFFFFFFFFVSFSKT